MPTHRASIPTRKPWFSRWHCAELIVSFLVCHATLAEDRGTLAFNFAAQPLDAALTRFASITGWEVGFVGNLANRRTAPALQGRFTPAQALQRLLHNSGLGYEIGPDHFIKLKPKADKPPADGDYVRVNFFTRRQTTPHDLKPEFFQSSSKAGMGPMPRVHSAYPV